MGLKTIQLRRCERCNVTYASIQDGSQPRRYGHVFKVHRQLTWRPGEVELVIEATPGPGIETVTVKTRCKCKETTRV